MTRTNIFWAICISLTGTAFGVPIMFGHVPGHGSDVGTFERIAGVAEMAVARYGHLTTGFGAIVSGFIAGGLCLIGGDGSPDSGLGAD